MGGDGVHRETQTDEYKDELRVGMHGYIHACVVI
jgi:hypothetical protein